MTVRELHDWLGELMTRSPGIDIAPVYVCDHPDGDDAIVNDAIDRGCTRVYLVAPGSFPDARKGFRW